MFGLFKRKRRDPPVRPPLSGSLLLGGREWRVREERRAGPWPQLFVLTAEEAPASEIHVRVREGEQVAHLEDLTARAEHPTYRWFADAGGARWEARIVLPDAPGERLVKFVSWELGVFEGVWPHQDGLGACSDDELRALLESLRAAG